MTDADRTITSTTIAPPATEAAGVNPRVALPSTPDKPDDATPRLSLWQRIKEDHAAHRRDWTRPGFRAVAVHRFGVWRMGIRSKLLRAPFSLLYRALHRRVRNVYGIELPYSAKLGRRVVVEHQSGIVIHGNAVIGDDCVIRQGVTMGVRHESEPDQAPVLGQGVSVGAGAVIIGGITIGDGANIGANAVVLKDVPPGSTAVGIPAKIIPPKTPTLESREAPE